MYSVHCGGCGFNNTAVSARERRSMAHCDGCDEWFCVECLREVAVGKELISQATVDEAGDDASGYLFRDEASGESLCAECWENADR